MFGILIRGFALAVIFTFLAFLAMPDSSWMWPLGVGITAGTVLTWMLWPSSPSSQRRDNQFR